MSLQVLFALPFRRKRVSQEPQEEEKKQVY